MKSDKKDEIQNEEINKYNSKPQEKSKEKVKLNHYSGR